jgi:hypothetical protein
MNPDTLQQNVEMATTITVYLVIVWAFVTLPVQIAKRRGVSTSRIVAIEFLSVLGMFVGLTWFIAMWKACFTPREKHPPFDPRCFSTESERLRGEIWTKLWGLTNEELTRTKEFVDAFARKMA